MVDEGIMLSWYRTYVAEGGEDPHSRFADRLGISRQQAKRLCYKIAYTIHRSEVMGVYKSWPSLKSKRHALNQDNIIAGNNAQE